MTRFIALFVGLTGWAWLVTAVNPAPTIEEMERAVVERVNAIRSGHKGRPLRTDEGLSRVAREHSCALLERGSLSHTDAAGGSIGDRVRAAGRTFRVVGENLAANVNARDPVSAAVDGWMRSPGHRENILRPEFTETGVGVCANGSAYYFTQVFVRPAVP